MMPATMLLAAPAKLVSVLAGATNISAIFADLSFLASALPALLFSVNFWLFRRPGRRWNRRPLEAISVLIPARNEEQSIGAAVAAVLASRGVELELIVLDDGSTDHTAEVVASYALRDKRVRVELAPPLPIGWNGKQHACWALASKASYQVFCFLDADVRIGSEALYAMSSELGVRKSAKPEMALVSGFPRQLTETFLEQLLLPLIHFVLLGFLPLPGERWSGYSGFAAGCGQVMMVRREPYFRSGGHSSIPTTMHDGLLLPQLFRNHGFRTSVYDLSRDAVCRMYSSAQEVWSGLGKNATEGMASPGRIGIFTILLLLGQVLPLPLLIFAEVAGDERTARLSLLALLLGYCIRVISAWRYEQSWVSMLLHPLGVFLLLVLQWNALFNKLRRRPATWKQRAYVIK